MNKVIISGNLTRDVELTKANDLLIGKFSLGVSRTTKNKDGNYESDFLNCVVFNPGEYIQNNLLKGVRVLVEGRMQTKQYEKDGKNHYSTDIIVERIEILKKSENVPKTEEKAPNNPFEQFGESIKTESDIGEQIKIEDSDLPF